MTVIVGFCLLLLSCTSLTAVIKPQSFQDMTAVQCLENFEDLELNKTFKLSYLISVLFIYHFKLTFLRKMPIKSSI